MMSTPNPRCLFQTVGGSLKIPKNRLIFFIIGIYYIVILIYNIYSLKEVVI